MEPNKLVSLVENIIGRKVLTRRQKADLKALFEVVLSGKKYEEKPKETGEPNNLKEEENTLDISSATNFRFPQEFNLEMEGEEGYRRMKIFPDGLTEN